MADKLLPTAIGEPNSVFQRLKDMGNGTHARVVQQRHRLLHRVILPAH